VSGSHGPLVVNPKPRVKHRVHQKLFGTVIEAVDKNRYKVRFDDGSIKDCFSNTLKIEKEGTGIPASEAEGRRASQAAASPASPSNCAIQEPDTCVLDAGDDVDFPFQADFEDEEDEAVEEQEQENQGCDDEVEPEEETPALLPNGNMEVSEEDVHPDYHGQLERARVSMKGMIGRTVETKKGSGSRQQSLVWKVVEEVHNSGVNRDRKNIGLKNFNLNSESKTILADLFLWLQPKDWRIQFQKFNAAIEKESELQPQKKKVALFSEREVSLFVSMFAMHFYLTF
jgi:hypothetical protein